MITEIINSELKLSIENGKLIVVGDTELIKSMAPAIRLWKLELLMVIQAETIRDVGECDHCHAGLLGLITFDRYINRVCPECGKWHRCRQLSKPPSPTIANPVCNTEPISLF